MAPKKVQVLGRDMWWEQISMLLDFQWVVWQCLFVGGLGIVFVEDNAQLFWTCMYEFTNDVKWFVPITQYQKSETGVVFDK